MMPLSLASIGESHKIQKVGGKEDVKKHLEHLGFVVGSNVSLITIMSGNVIVNVKDTRIAISKELAQRILIS